MKPPTLQTIALFACAGLILAVAVGATNQERIRWTYENPPWYYSTERMQRVQFGLRNDGVVVWREIVPASSAVTNSPAEQAEAITNEIRYWTVTNMPVTNWLKPDWTNITIKPIYIPPWHHPEWTNWEEGARWWSNYTNWK